ASLLEEERPNVFQMSVANILPGDRIQVELDYTELLVPEEGTYELVFPTVVGPRYSHAPVGTAGSEFVETPYAHAGEPAPSRFTLDARIRAGMPIESVTSPSHEVAPRFEAPGLVSVRLDDGKGGDK